MVTSQAAHSTQQPEPSAASANPPSHPPDSSQAAAGAQHGEAASGPRSSASLQKQRKHQRLQEKGSRAQAAAPQEFPRWVDPGECQLAFRVAEVPVPLPAEDFQQEYALYDKYQKRVHGDKETVSLWAGMQAADSVMVYGYVRQKELLVPPGCSSCQDDAVLAAVAAEQEITACCCCTRDKSR